MATPVRSPHRAEAGRLYRLGWSLAQIGEHVGVSRQRVHQWITEDGHRPVSGGGSIRRAERFRREREARVRAVFQDEQAVRAVVAAFDRGGMIEAQSVVGDIAEQIVRAVLPPELVRLHPRCQGRTRYTDEDMLDAIRQTAVAGRLTAAQYRRRADASCPSLALVYRRFGGWFEACRQAGVECGVRYGADHPPARTRQQALDEVWPVCAVKVPTMRSYQAWRDAQPDPKPISSSGLVYVFGSWKQFVTAAIARREERR